MCQYGLEICSTIQTFSVRNLFDDSNFLGFQGSRVERDSTQLVTVAFQGIIAA